MSTEEKVKVVDEKHAINCIEYILESESDDYTDWCLDTGRNPAKLKNNTEHIYAVAMLSVGRAW